VGQQLSEQQQRATEAGRALTQESVSTYTDFVNSMFSFQQEATQQAQRQTQRSGQGAGRRRKKQQA
jgi:hypothetical protein